MVPLVQSLCQSLQSLSLTRIKSNAEIVAGYMHAAPDITTGVGDALIAAIVTHNTQLTSLHYQSREAVGTIEITSKAISTLCHSSLGTTLTTLQLPLMRSEMNDAMVTMIAQHMTSLTAL